jgi:hypothetical protein
MKWLAEQWERSSIISGVLAISIWGTICALALLRFPIPDIMYAGGMGVVGFFFGAKYGEQRGETTALRKLRDD